MKIALSIALCLGLAFATLNIPLKSQAITTTDNGVETHVDTVLYVLSSVSHLGTSTNSIDEKVLLDTASNVNYVISSETKAGAQAVSPNAFACGTFCDTKNGPTTPQSILGGKSSVQGGAILNASSTVEVEDEKLQYNLYVPATVDEKTSKSSLAVLQFANAGLSLGRGSNAENLVKKLAKVNKQVQSNKFSLYVHDKVPQLNLGGANEYLAEPHSKQGVLPTVDADSWKVAVSNLSTKNGNFLKVPETLNANFDTTSQFIYVPHTEPASAGQEGNYYFMTDKELPCFAPNKNLDAQVYVCEAGKFPGYSSYGPITLAFKTATEDHNVILQSEDYIHENQKGDYELLFKFTKAPQNLNELYLGTSFLKKVYPTFNLNEKTVTLQSKYNVDVPANGTELDNAYRLPLIIVGSILGLGAVGALFAILKKTKVDSGSFSGIEVPLYLSQSKNAFSPVVNNANATLQNAYNQVPSTTVTYSPPTAVTYSLPQNQQGIYNQVQSVVANTGFNPQNVVPQNNALRQSQAQPQVRQSQNIPDVRNVVQNYVLRQNY